MRCILACIMATAFVLGIGDRYYGISAQDRGSLPARLGVLPLARRPETGANVRLEPGKGTSLVHGAIDYSLAETLLMDASFWSSLAPDSAASLAEIATRIQKELVSGRPGSQALAGAWAVELLVSTLRIAAMQQPAHGTWAEPAGVWSVDDVMRYIESRYTETFNLDWFVARCAMNVSDFSRRFKEHAGCPLFEFINRQRVARACTLLKTSDLSILEIAMAVGYNNLSFFNRYFLRIVGISPRSYRSSSTQ